MADDAREHTGNQAGHGQPPYHGVPANALPLTANEDRQWATLAHFGGILGCVPSLLIYLIFKDRGPFTAQESKEALNVTLPPTIAAVVANLLVLLPVVGNIFDFFYKANQRNVNLLKRHYQEGRYTGSGTGILIAIALALLVLLALVVYGTWQLISYLVGLI